MKQLIEKYKSEFRVKHAIRVAFTATLALFFPILFRIHQLAWFAPFSVIISMNFYPHDSLQKMCERLIGIAIGVSFALFALAVIHSLLVYILYVVLFTFYTAYLQGKHFKYHFGAALCMIMFNFVAVVGFTSPIDAMQVGLHLVLMMFFAVCSITLTNIIFFRPNIAANLLPMMLKDYFLHLVKILNYRRDPLVSDYSAWTNYLKSMAKNTENQLTKKEYAEINNIVYRAAVIRTKLADIEQYRQSISPDMKVLLDDVKYLQKILSKDLIALIKFYLGKSNITPQLKFPKALREIEQRANEKLHLQQSSQAQAFLLILHEFNVIADDLTVIKSNMTHNYSMVPSPIVTAAHSASLHKAALLFATRMTLSIMITIFLTIYFNLPGGIQTIIAAIVMAAQANLGASTLRMLLRFLGIFVGLLAALVIAILVSQTGSFILFLVLFFLGIYILVDLAFINEDYSYWGNQAALVFPMLLFFTGSPIIDPSEVFDRFIGVMLGSIIGGLVLFYIAPIFPQPSLKQMTDKIFSRLKDFLSALGRYTQDRAVYNAYLDDIQKLMDSTSQLNFHRKFLQERKHGGNTGLAPLQLLFREMRRFARANLLLPLEDNKKLVQFQTTSQPLIDYFGKKLQSVSISVKEDEAIFAQLLSPLLKFAETEELSIETRIYMNKIILCFREMHKFLLQAIEGVHNEKS